jgi:hypothetical protein
MGNFYCNFTTRGPSSDEIVRLLSEHRRSGYVTPTHAGKTVVFDREADELDPSQIDAVGSLLSRELACPALAAMVADDDELWLTLYEGGERRVEYWSRGPNRGAYAMCRAFGRPWMVPLVWVLLQSPYMLMESLRHFLVAKALGIPSWCVSTGFRYIEGGELPPYLEMSDLRRTARLGH